MHFLCKISVYGLVLSIVCLLWVHCGYAAEAQATNNPNPFYRVEIPILFLREFVSPSVYALVVVIWFIFVFSITLLIVGLMVVLGVRLIFSVMTRTPFRVRKPNPIEIRAWKNVFFTADQTVKSQLPLIFVLTVPFFVLPDTALTKDEHATVFLCLAVAVSVLASRPMSFFKWSTPQPDFNMGEKLIWCVGLCGLFICYLALFKENGEAGISFPPRVSGPLGLLFPILLGQSVRIFVQSKRTNNHVEGGS